MVRWILEPGGVWDAMTVVEGVDAALWLACTAFEGVFGLGDSQITLIITIAWRVFLCGEVEIVTKR